jgi:hypothetical protein
MIKKMIPVYITGTPMTFSLSDNAAIKSKMAVGEIYKHSSIGKLFCNDVQKDKDGKISQIYCSIMDNKKNHGKL